jgi:nucleotide-binding universal stress UspA family protein
MAFDRVVVPLDGSPESRAILSYLPRLLRSRQSEVILVRAVPFLSTLLELSNGLASGPPSMGSDISEVEGQVASVVRELRDRGIRARGITRVAAIIELIRQVIRKEDPAVIALSQRPPEGWPLFSGTLGERIARATTLPLFILNVFGPPQSWTEAFPARTGPATLLVPLAGSAAAADAVELAARLARPGGDSVQLEALADADASLADTLSAAAWGLSRLERERIPARKRATRGDPARVLFEEARGDSADVLVVTPRLLPGEGADPLGGLVTAVLRRARIPVAVSGRRGTRAREGSPVEPQGSAGDESRQWIRL